ncbi:MAG: hypothetical protein WC509_02620 [Candidatus Izemoplasmatales bacterium]
MIILTRNSFYNNFSDDIIQYYSIMCDFIDQIKEGTLSFFNLNNYLGASFFSDVYYIPLDIFTFITLLLSYVFPTELAYSTTELIKIWAGVMVFAYYLRMTGMKNRTIFWMGIVYFVSGGSVSFMAFPVFLSLTFYLPAALVAIQYFFRGKKWVVPLFTCALVFYDFYLAYSAMAFMSVLYVVEALKRPGNKVWPFLRDGVSFLGLILLGVAMAGVILYPSILFILEDTYRTEGSFNAWVVEVFGYELKLFQPEIYIRVLAKIFTEQKGIGFYGFENNYGLEHVSLYITIVGMAFMSYIWFMRGRIARVYKVLIPFGLVLIFFPIFSYVFSGTTDSPYTRWINMMPLVETMILAYVFDEHGFETEKMGWLTIPLSLLLGLVGFLIYYYIEKLGIDTYYASRDIMTADTILMGVAAVFLVLVLVFGWIGKRRWIRTVFWVECLVAVVYAYSGPFSIANKIDTFESMHSIDAFLEDHLERDEFYRVYVDLSRFDVEQLNFNRMTSFPTNTEIFHSWTDAETNGIGCLLFDACGYSGEYQTKRKLDTLALYLNHFLGYRYVLVSAVKNYTLDSAYFTYVAGDDTYRLYEIADAEPFQVYESYMEYDDFQNFSSINTQIATQKLLLMHVLIDGERYDATSYNLLRATPANEGTVKTLNAHRSESSATLVTTAGIADPTERAFYRYDEDALDIGFGTGAIYINVSSLTPLDYGEVFMEFENGNRDDCEVVSGLTHQVKCEFWLEPVAIYFEQNAAFNQPKTLQYRLERAIGGAAYLVYDFDNVAFSRDSGMLYFQMYSSLTFDRVFVVDELDNETECFEGYYYFDTIPERMYVFKTNDMYNYANPFNLSIRYVIDDLTAYDQYADGSAADGETMAIERGTIRLSYQRTSDTDFDQIVMIPVAYSEEWKITSGQDYETLSVSGGFLGIVIPHGVADISLTLRFEPKGLPQGALATASSTAIYALVFLIPYLIRRGKRRRTEPTKEATEHEETDDHRSIL